jgi:arylsulfatase
MLENNRVIMQPGHVVDVLPTLLELSGTTIESEGYSVDGISMLPLLEGKEWPGHDFFLSGLDRFRMYREGRWKIVRTNGEQWQLYDMENDPTEMHDLARENDAIVERLEEDYLEYLEGKSFY